MHEVLGWTSSDVVRLLHDCAEAIAAGVDLETALDLIRNGERKATFFLSVPGLPPPVWPDMARILTNLGLCRSAALRRYPELAGVVADPVRPLERAVELFDRVRDPNVDVPLLQLAHVLVDRDRWTEAFDAYVRHHHLVHRDRPEWPSLQLMSTTILRSERIELVPGRFRAMRTALAEDRRLLGLDLDDLLLQIWRDAVRDAVDEATVDAETVWAVESAALCLQAVSDDASTEIRFGLRSRYYAEAHGRRELPVEHEPRALRAMIDAIELYADREGGGQPLCYHLRGRLLLRLGAADPSIRWTASAALDEVAPYLEQVEASAPVYSRAALLVSMVQVALPKLSTEAQQVWATRLAVSLRAVGECDLDDLPPGDRALLSKARATIEGLLTGRPVAEPGLLAELLANARRRAPAAPEGDTEPDGWALQVAQGSLLFERYMRILEPALLVHSIEVQRPLVDAPTEDSTLQARALVTCAGAASLLASHPRTIAPERWRSCALGWASAAIEHPRLAQEDWPRVRVNHVKALLAVETASLAPGDAHRASSLVREVIEHAQDRTDPSLLDPLAKAIMSGCEICVRAPEIPADFAQQVWDARTMVLPRLRELPATTQGAFVTELCKIGWRLSARDSVRELASTELPEHEMPATVRADLAMQRGHAEMSIPPSASSEPSLRKALHHFDRALELDDDPAGQLDARQARYQTWALLLHASDARDIVNATVSDLRDHATQWDGVAEAQDTETRWDRQLRRTFLFAVDTYTTALLRGGAASAVDHLTTVEQWLTRARDLHASAPERARVDCIRGLLLGLDEFPTATRGAAALHAFRACRMALMALPADERFEARATERQCILGQALALLQTSSDNWDQTATIASTAGSLAAAARQITAPEDRSGLAECEYVSGIAKHRLAHASCAHAHAAVEHFREAERLSREGTSPILRHRILNNLATALDGVEAEPALAAAIDEEIVTMAREPAVTSRAEVRIARRVAGSGRPDAILARAGALARQAFDRDDHDNAWQLALVAANHDEPRRIRWLQLALRAATHAMIGQPYLAGSSLAAHRYIQARQELVVALTGRGEIGRARELLAMWPPVPLRVLQYERRFARDRNRPRALWLRQLSEDAEQAAPSAGVSEIPLKSRMRRAFDTTLDAILWKPLSAPVDPSGRACLSHHGFLLFHPDAPGGIIRRPTANGAWLIGLTHGPDELHQAFRTIDAYLAALRTLKKVRELIHTLEIADEDARQVVSQREAELDAQRREAMATLTRLSRWERRTGYLAGHRLLALLDKIDDALTRPEPGELPLLARARARIEELWSDDVRQAIDECRRELGASLAALGEPVTLVPESVLHLLPVEMATERTIQWSIDGAPEAPLPWTSSSRALVIASPTGDLPGAVAEARSIGAMLGEPAVTVRCGRAVSLGELVRILHDPRCRVLHFAGHGEFDLEGVHTGLLLGEGAKLTWREILDLDLSHLGLVVLSGCEGALSNTEDLAGGYNSLAAAFLAAGARHVVAARWKVSDEATAFLMARFYPRWSAGAHPATALRDSVRASAEEHPDLIADLAAWCCWTS